MDDHSIEFLRKTLLAFFLDARKEFMDCDEDTITIEDVQEYIEDWLDDEMTSGKMRRKREDLIK